MEREENKGRQEREATVLIMAVLLPLLAAGAPQLNRKRNRANWSCNKKVGKQRWQGRQAAVDCLPS